MTPNPDILCNKTIKFGSFLRACEEKLDVDWLATGHYARVAKCHQGEGKSSTLIGWRLVTMSGLPSVFYLTHLTHGATCCRLG